MANDCKRLISAFIVTGAGIDDLFKINQIFGYFI
jgi:hypothetical protein